MKSTHAKSSDVKSQKCAHSKAVPNKSLKNRDLNKKAISKQKSKNSGHAGSAPTEPKKSVEILRLCQPGFDFNVVDSTSNVRKICDSRLPGTPSVVKCIDTKYVRPVAKRRPHKLDGKIFEDDLFNIQETISHGKIQDVSEVESGEDLVIFRTTRRRSSSVTTSSIIRTQGRKRASSLRKTAMVLDSRLLRNNADNNRPMSEPLAVDAMFALEQFKFRAAQEIDNVSVCENDETPEQKARRISAREAQLARSPENETRDFLLQEGVIANERRFVQEEDEKEVIVAKPFPAHLLDRKLTMRRAEDQMDAVYGQSPTRSLDTKAVDDLDLLPLRDDKERLMDPDWMKGFDVDFKATEDEVKENVEAVVERHTPSFVESMKEKFGLPELSMQAFLAKYANFTEEQIHMMKRFRTAVDSMENLMFFILQLWNCDSTIMTFGTVQMYLSTLMGSEYFLEKNALSALIASTSVLLHHAFKREKKPSISTHGLGDELSMMSQTFTHVLDSSIAKAISGLIITAVSFKFFDKDLAHDIYEVIGYPKKMSILEIAKYVLDCVAKLIKASEIWICGKMSLYDIFMKDDPVAAALAQLQTLISTQDLTYVGLPVPGLSSRVEWLAQSSGVLEVLKRAIALLSPQLEKRKELEKKYYELLKVHISLEEGNMSRPTPIGIILHGDPSVGKSNILTAIYEIYCRVIGIQYKPSYVFSKVQSSEYWDGYKGREHPICFMSEVGSDTPSMATKIKNETLDLLTSLLDSQPYPLNMASCPEKGKAYFLSGLLAMDTNNKDMNIPLLKMNPAAYFRRFLYIEVKVLLKYRMAGSSAIDPEKCNDGAGWLDRYSFAVYIRTPIDCKRSHPIYLMNHQADDDVYKFFAVLTKYMTDFMAKQAAMLAKRYDNTEYNQYFDPANKIVVAPSACPPPSQVPNTYDGVGQMFGSTQAISVHARPVRQEVKYEYDHSLEDHSTDGRLYEQLVPNPMTDEEIRQSLEECRNRRPTARVIYPPTWRERFLQFSLFCNAHRQRCWESAKDWFNTIPTSCSEMIQVGAHVTSEVKDIAYYKVVDAVTSHLTGATESPNPHSYVTFSFFRGLSGALAFTMIMALGYNPLLLLTLPFLMFAQPAPIRTNIFKAETLKLRDKARETIATKQYGLHRYLGWQAFKFQAPQFVMFLDGLKWVSMTIGLILAGVTVVSVVSSHVVKKKKQEIKEKEVEIVENVIQTHSTSFVDEDETTDDLTLYEKSVNAGKSYHRIPNRMSKMYNAIVHRMPVVHTSDIESLHRVACGNVRRIRICSGTGYTQFGVLVHPTILWINRHSFKEFPCRVRISFPGNYDDADEIKSESIINENDVVQIADDMILISVSGLTCSSLVKFFSDDCPTPGMPLRSMIGKDYVTASFGEHPILFNDNKGKQILINQYFHYKWKDGADGMCGWPLIVPHGNGYVIAGMHGGGVASEGDGYSPYVSKDAMQKGIKMLQRQVSLMPIMCASRKIPEVEEPLAQSAFCYERLQGLTYFGKTKGPVLAKGVSKLKPTFLVNSGSIFKFEELVSNSPETIYLPPMMQKTKIDGQFYSPVNYGLKKMSQQRGCVDRDVVRTCVDLWSSKLIKDLKANGLTKLEPLDIETAINGVDYDAFLRRIDASKASGHGKAGPKAKYIPIVGEIDGIPVRQPVKSVREELLDALKEYESDHCSGVVYTAALKDEPREKSRALSGNTRLFYVSPLTSLILARMHLAPFYTLMVQFSKIFDTAIGTDMHREGHHLWKILEDFSPLWMEGDYSKYDLVMPFEIKWGSATVILRVLEAFGYNEKALNTVRGILSDELFPMVELMKDLFSLPGIQCSGAYATAEKNSLDGVMLFLVSWYSHPVLKDKDFFSYVKMMVYGDDVLAAVKTEVSTEFNNQTYQKFCADVYKMDYTPAAKKGELQKFVSPQTASFLKRTIRWHSGLNRKVTALGMDSLHKMLRWYSAGDCTPQEQYAGMFSSLLTELFLQVDKDVYCSVRNFLIEEYCGHFKVEERSVSPLLPSYDTMFDNLNSKVIDVQSRPISSAPVYATGYFEDHVVALEVELKNAEEVLNSMQHPFPGLDLNAVRETYQYLENYEVQVATEEYFVHVAKVESLEKTLAMMKKCVAKRNIRVHSKKLCPLVETGRNMLRVKQMISPLPKVIVEGSVKIRLFSEMDYVLKYLDALLAKYHSCGDDWKKIPVDDLPVVCGLTSWVIAGLFEMQVQWKKWCDFVGIDTLASVAASSVGNMVLLEVLDLIEASLKLMVSLDDDLEFVEVPKVIMTQSKALGEAVDGVVQTEEKHETIVDGTDETPTVDVPAVSSPYSIISSTQLDLSNFLKRPIHFANYTFTLGANLTTSIEPWIIFFGNAAIRSKLRNIAHLKGNLCVKFMLSGMPFHTGKVQFRYVPQCVDNAVGSFYVSNLAAYRKNALIWLSQRKAAYVDIKSNISLTIKMPYINYKPLFRLYNQSAGSLAAASNYEDMNFMGRLFINTMHPITASTPDASVPYMESYAWFEDETFGCTTGSVTVITTESRSDERKTGPVEKMATSAQKFASSLGDVPVIGPYAKASSMVLSGVSTGAAALGWSYPVLNSYPSRIKNEPFQNGAQTIGMDTGKRLTLDPKQELTVDLSVCGSADDEMTIAGMGNVESLLTQFVWHADHAPYTCEWTCVVHPRIFDPDLTGPTNCIIQPTPMNAAATPFAYWKADSIEFKFMIETNAFVRGKFAIVYEPNIAQYASVVGNVQLNKQWSRIYDLQVTQEVSVCVEWGQSRPWLENTTDTILRGSVGTVATPANWNNIANGFIMFVPVTEIQSNDGSDLNINVFVKANGLDVNTLTTKYMPTTRVMTHSRADPVEDMPHTCDVLNPSGFKSLGVCEHYFGERPISFRALMKRFTTTYVGSVAVGATQTLVTMEIKIVPDIYPAMAGTALGTNIWFLLNYLRYMFLGMRGGLRKRIRMSGIPNVGSMGNVVVSFLAPATSTASYTGTASTGVAKRILEGSLSFAPETNGGIEFALPMPSTNLYLPAGNDAPYDLGNTNQAESTIRNYSAAFELIAPGAAIVVTFVEETATDEDFNMSYFVGVPPHSITI